MDMDLRLKTPNLVGCQCCGSLQLLLGLGLGLVNKGEKKECIRKHTVLRDIVKRQAC